jgi:hypothetical protein
MEPVGPLICSQNSATVLYPEIDPIYSSHISFLEFYFNIFLIFTLGLVIISLPLDFTTKFLYAFLISMHAT